MAIQHTGWQNYGPGIVGRYVPSGYGGGGGWSLGTSPDWQLALGRRRRGGGEQSFTSMPDLANLMNTMTEGEFFTVGDQRFKWNGRDAVPVDEEGRTTGEGLAAAFEEAEAELPAGYEQLESEAMGMTEGLGEAERTRLRRDWGEYATKARTGAHQWAISHGLEGTTISPSLQRGAEEGAQRNLDIELGRLEEGLRREKLGTMLGVRGEKLAMMERRTPDYMDLYGMQQGLGEWGAGGQGVYGSTQPTGGGGYGTGGVAGRVFGPTEGVDTSTMGRTGGWGQTTTRRRGGVYGPVAPTGAAYQPSEFVREAEQFGRDIFAPPRRRRGRGPAMPGR